MKYCNNNRNINNGKYCMLVCRVLIGATAKGKPYGEPPLKSDRKTRVETLVDNIHNPSIFVATRDYCALPVYYIWFDKKNDIAIPNAGVPIRRRITHLHNNYGMNMFHYVRSSRIHNAPIANHFPHRSTNLVHGKSNIVHMYKNPYAGLEWLLILAVCCFVMLAWLFILLFKETQKQHLALELNFENDDICWKNDFGFGSTYANETCYIV